MTLERFGDPARAARWCAEVRSSGARLGFIPTMGALHEAT
jgi:pantothenate synthetase